VTRFVTAWPHKREAGNEVRGGYSANILLQKRFYAAEGKCKAGLIKGSNASMLNLTWDEYRSKIAEADADADLRDTARLAPRLEVLQHCGDWFDRAASFVHLDALQRKAIAGAISSKADRTRLLRQFRTNADFGIFGSMVGSGMFVRCVNENRGALALSRAIDAIPRTGTVTSGDYDTFITEFCEILDFDSPLATSSRLLAMKRPDMFVCVTRGNRGRLAQMLGLNQADMTVQTYWDRVIQPIHASPWHQAPAPMDNTDQKIWRGRVALLDLVFADFAA